MHVHLKLVLDCPPDAAWRALRSSSVFTQVSAPFLTFEPLGGAAGFPEQWDAGPHPVRVRALGGRVDAGTQNIDVAFRTLGAVRILEDRGGPLGFWLFWQWRGLALARSASGFACRFAAD